MVYVLNFSAMTDEEKAVAVCLQGIVNRTEKSIVIDVDNYMRYVTDSVRVYTDVYEATKKFLPKLRGMALYKLDSHDVGINMAATYAAVNDVLGVPDVLADRFADMGLAVKADFRKIVGTNAERQKVVFDRCYDKLNKNGLVHQVVNGDNFHIRLRDLSICNGWACVYTGESDEDRRFRKYVLGKLDCNIPVYGWNDDEIAFIRDISEYGDYALPSDWSMNHSYFEASDATLKQRIHGEVDTVAPNKHYVALVVSDGDNIQWLERNFSLPEGSFGQRLATNCNYKMSWTFSPSLVKICPDGARHIFASAKKDYFVSGVSGVGYANALRYPREHLDEFTRQTAEAMARSDLSVVTLLDNVADTEDVDYVADRLHAYTRFDNIDGGVWELDPDRYGSGKGRIFWSDGKPFVSVRFTMWYPTGNPVDVNKEWLENMAEQVNAMPVAPESEDGYTVVNVHPWTMSQADVDYFVSKLDGDKVELVYADELIKLVKNNVKR